jgi:formate dehydrogenase subunit gamma
MMGNPLRHLGALILGAALALPLAAQAQDAKNAPPDVKMLDQPARNGTDAPKSGGEKNAQKPQPPQVVPAPVKGSTAVPGWNNPPAWGSISETRQYASLPGIDTNRLIQRQGREWRAFRNGPLTTYGGWFIGLVFLAIMLF